MYYADKLNSNRINVFDNLFISMTFRDWNTFSPYQNSTMFRCYIRQDS